MYLLGDVKKEQANKVIGIARNASGVTRVVKLLKYYTYQTGGQLAGNKVAR